MRVHVALLVLFASTGCRTLNVTYPPPMRRHVEPMLKGAKVAVLVPKIESESGRLYIDDIFPGQKHEVADYDRVVAKSLASALELSGIAERAESVDVPAQDVMAWLDKPESRNYTHVVLAEIHSWSGHTGPSTITLLNPLSLLGLILQVPVLFGYADTACTMNVQLIDLASRETVMMLSPSESLATDLRWFNMISQGGQIEDHLTEFTKRLMNNTREELESRAILLAADGTVVPYTGHNFSIGARRKPAVPAPATVPIEPKR